MTIIDKIKYSKILSVDFMWLAYIKILEIHKSYNKSDERIGVNDLRTLNALYAHAWIIRKFIMDNFHDQRRDIGNKIDHLMNSLYAAKIILLKYVQNPDYKSQRKLINILKGIRKEEEQICVKLIKAVD